MFKKHLIEFAIESDGATQIYLDGKTFLWFRADQISDRELCLARMEERYNALRQPREEDENKETMFASNQQQNI